MSCGGQCPARASYEGVVFVRILGRMTDRARSISEDIWVTMVSGFGDLRVWEAWRGLAVAHQRVGLELEIECETAAAVRLL